MFKQQLPIVPSQSPPSSSTPRPSVEVGELAEHLDHRGMESSLPVGSDQHSERDRLIQAMEQAGWVKAKAARLLNLTPRQIGYALQKHSIPVKKF
jgi:Nif-specific regulatory protein